MIHKHPHPGEILKETVFDPLNLSVTEAEERLAMSRVALSRVLNAKAGISPNLALRLEKEQELAQPGSGSICRGTMIFD